MIKTENDQLRSFITLHQALSEIHEQQGKVCEQFEICDHVACASSYSAWAIADAALRRVRESFT